MFSFFKKHKHIDIPHHQPISPAIRHERSKLEQSAELLRQTTLDVTCVATNAALALEKHLKHYQYRFFQTIDSIDDLVVIKDGDGRWLMVNTFGQDLFGWKHGEYLHKTNDELAQEFPYLKDALLVSNKSDTKAWETGRSIRNEVHIPYGNSEKIFDIVKTPSYNDDGSRRELIVIGRDMTELLERQRRTKACFHAMNTASEGIVIIDSKARIIFSNDEFNRKFGIKDYESILNERLVDVLPWLTKYDDVWQHARMNKSIKIATEESGDILVVPMMNGLPKPIYFICTFKK